MVIDSSAIVGLLVDETVNEAIIEALRADERRLVAAPTRLEMTIVMQRSGIVGGVASVRAALDGLDVIDVPFDRKLADLAIEAHARWGKGNHPAKLNFGDCFTYAVAKQTGEPVLCVGDDFARTDVPVVPLS
jgi:ribonuclease VapC